MKKTTVIIVCILFSSAFALAQESNKPSNELLEYITQGLDVVLPQEDNKANDEPQEIVSILPNEKESKPKLEKQAKKEFVYPKNEVQLNMGANVYWSHAVVNGAGTNIAHSYNIFSLSYYHRFTKGYWLGGMFTYTEGSKNDYGGHKGHSCGVSTRFSYLNRPLVTIYSGLSAGLYWESNKKTWSPDHPLHRKYTRTIGIQQLTLVGASLGKRVVFNVELGIGYKGFISGGVGYQF
jgi:hypothetical protein